MNDKDSGKLAEIEDAEIKDFKSKQLALEITEAIEIICLRHDFDIKALAFVLSSADCRTPTGFKLKNANRGQLFALHSALGYILRDVNYNLNNFDQLIQ